MTGSAPTLGRDYLRELDGVRALAFLLVLAYHAPLSLLGRGGAAAVAWLETGYFGVDVFFVLSGFVVTRVLLADRERGHGLAGFYLRRVLRICPIYLLLLGIVALVDPFPGLGWCLVWLANYHQIDGGNLYYLGHLWSLSVEEHFYLAWPLLVLLAGPRRGPWLVFLLLLPLCAVTAWYYFAHEPERLVLALGVATTARAPSLGLGALMAFWETPIRSRPLRATAWALAAVLVAMLTAQWFFDLTGVAAWVAASGMRDPHRLLPIFSTVSHGLVSAAIVLVVVAWAGTGVPWVAWLRTAPLRYTGTISYGLYVYHLPVLFLFGRQRLDEDSTAARGLSLLAIAAVFAIAALSFRFIEQPLIRLGRRGRS